MFAKLSISRRVSILVALLVALYGASATGQSAAAPLTLTTAPASQKPAASVAAPAAEEESAPLKNDASHQDVKVHGHWKIVVKNPDGSVARSVEFENSLTSTGAGFVGNIMAGDQVSGGQAIFLLTSGIPICGKTACGIVPGSSATSGPFSYVCTSGFGAQQPTVCATGMTQSLLGNGFTLAGQLTASQAGTVTQVQTLIAVCAGSVTASACSSGSGASDLSFTSTNLPTAVSVSSGQVVQVSVAITFS